MYRRVQYVIFSLLTIGYIQLLVGYSLFSKLNICFGGEPSKNGKDIIRCKFLDGETGLRIHPKSFTKVSASGFFDPSTIISEYCGESTCGIRTEQIKVSIECEETHIYSMFNEQFSVRWGDLVECKLKPKYRPLTIEGRCFESGTTEDLSGCKVELFVEGEVEPRASFLTDVGGRFYLTATTPPVEGKQLPCELRFKYGDVEIPSKKVIVDKQWLILEIITLEIKETSEAEVPQAEDGRGEGEEIGSHLGGIAKSGAQPKYGMLLGKVESQDGTGISDVKVTLKIDQVGSKEVQEEVVMQKVTTGPSGLFLAYLYIPESLKRSTLQYTLLVEPKAESEFEPYNVFYPNTKEFSTATSETLVLPLPRKGNQYLTGKFSNLPPEVVKGSKVLLFPCEEVKQYNDTFAGNKGLSPFDQAYLKSDATFEFKTSKNIPKGKYSLILKIPDGIAWCYPEDISINPEPKNVLHLDISVPEKYYTRASKIDVLTEGGKLIPITVSFTLEDKFYSLAPCPLPIKESINGVNFVGVPLNAIKKINVKPLLKNFDEAIFDPSTINKGVKIYLSELASRDLIIVWLPYGKKDLTEKAIVHIADEISKQKDLWKRWWIVSEGLVIQSHTWEKEKIKLRNVKIYPKSDTIEKPLVDSIQWFFKYFDDINIKQKRSKQLLTKLTILLVGDSAGFQLPEKKPSKDIFKETSEKLVKLPDGIKFSEDLKNKIRYDNSNQLLIFRGIMSQEEKNKLLNLSTDDTYKKAIEALFQRSLDRVLLRTELEKIRILLCTDTPEIDKQLATEDTFRRAIEKLVLQQVKIETKLVSSSSQDKIKELGYHLPIAWREVGD